MKYTLLVFTVLLVMSPLGEAAQLHEPLPPERPAVNDPISGDWEGTILIQGKKGPARFNLKLDGDRVTYEDPQGRLTGSWDGNDLTLKGERPGVTTTGEKLTFVMTMTAKLQDGKLVGEIEFNVQGSKMQGTWEANRKASSPPPPAEQSSVNQPQRPGKELVPQASVKALPESQTPPAPGSVGTKAARIVGRVFRSDNDASSEDVEVELSDENAPKEQKKVGRTMTDAKGMYSFTDVKPGKYSLVVTARNLDESSRPCKPSGLLALTRDKWFVSVARTQSGSIVEIILVDEFPVGAGGVVKKNVDLKCGD